LQARVSNVIKTLDFMFENGPIKVIANADLPEIRLVGLVVGPFEEGNSYEIPFWVARKLEKQGIIRFRDEDLLDSAKLYKIQWKERLQTAVQLSEFPGDFYPKIRRYLSELKKEAVKSPEKMREYEKAKYLAVDIINLRLRKIVSLASTPVHAAHVLKNVTDEERFLYERISKIIEEWKKQLLTHENLEEAE